MSKPFGAKNAKTEEWEAFRSYILEGGLKKFRDELDKLEGKPYVDAFLSLLEYHKPKLSRATVVGDPEAPLLPLEAALTILARHADQHTITAGSQNTLS